MIDANNLLWFAAGLVVGFLHASMLWRDVHKFTAWSPLMGMLRLSLVAASLVVAAVSGQILAGAAGWAVGLATLGTLFMARRRSRAAGIANTPPGE